MLDESSGQTARDDLCEGGQGRIGRRSGNGEDCDGNALVMFGDVSGVVEEQNGVGDSPYASSQTVREGIDQGVVLQETRAVIGDDDQYVTFIGFVRAMPTARLRQMVG